MIDLKPCPCCPSGGKSTLMLNGSIQCLECGLFQHSGAVPWNTRPSPWKPIGEGLPKEESCVLLYHPEWLCVEPAFWDDIIEEWAALDERRIILQPLVWMPLPLPPEEKQ